jgi:ABC-type Fe3+-siderophore transport system permease subunit
MWFKKRVSARLLFPAITTALNAIILFAAFSFLEGKAQYMMLLLMGVVASAFSPAAITVTRRLSTPDFGLSPTPSASSFRISSGRPWLRS